MTLPSKNCLEVVGAVGAVGVASAVGAVWVAAKMADAAIHGCTAAPVAAVPRYHLVLRREGEGGSERVKRREGEGVRSVTIRRRRGRPHVYGSAAPLATGEQLLCVWHTARGTWAPDLNLRCPPGACGW